MDFVVILAIMALIMVGIAWHANNRLRNKIYCTFRRVNKTKLEKFVQMTSRYIVFDGRKYDIIPSCITFIWWNKGLIYSLFPQWVASLDYTHDNRFPHDPNTLKPAIISPEVRNTMNKEEWTKSYAKTFTPPTTKKQTVLNQYLPWMAIGLVALMGFYVFVNFQSIQEHLSMLENSLNAIRPK